jgi:NAD(P)-dependent dehydrogenase (short-subunit alcohol dehydrogenase family)
MGAIDILVNNAGISGEVNLFETPEDEWDRVIDVNLKGCYLCAQAVGKGMTERKKGNIISIASTDGISAELIRRPYNVSKAGIIMLTRVLARQLASYGIRVNAIAPGWIKTEMTRPLWDYPERLKQVETQIPMGRIGEPEEIAGVALFLASEASSYITGHTIIADGGSLA